MTDMECRHRRLRASEGIVREEGWCHGSFLHDTLLLTPNAHIIETSPVGIVIESSKSVKQAPF